MLLCSDIRASTLLGPISKFRLKVNPAVRVVL